MPLRSVGGLPFWLFVSRVPLRCTWGYDPAPLRRPALKDQLQWTTGTPVGGGLNSYWGTAVSPPSVPAAGSDPD